MGKRSRPAIAGAFSHLPLVHRVRLKSIWLDDPAANLPDEIRVSVRPFNHVISKDCRA